MALAAGSEAPGPGATSLEVVILVIKYLESEGYKKASQALTREAKKVLRHADPDAPGVRSLKSILDEYLELQSKESRRQALLASNPLARDIWQLVEQRAAEAGGAPAEPGPALAPSLAAPAATPQRPPSAQPGWASAFPQASPSGESSQPQEDPHTSGHQHQDGRSEPYPLPIPGTDFPGFSPLGPFGSVGPAGASPSFPSFSTDTAELPGGAIDAAGGAAAARDSVFRERPHPQRRGTVAAQLLELQGRQGSHRKGAPRRKRVLGADSPLSPAVRLRAMAGADSLQSPATGIPAELLMNLQVNESGLMQLFNDKQIQDRFASGLANSINSSLQQAPQHQQEAAALQGDDLELNWDDLLQGLPTDDAMASLLEPLVLPPVAAGNLEAQLPPVDFPTPGWPANFVAQQEPSPAVRARQGLEGTGQQPRPHDAQLLQRYGSSGNGEAASAMQAAQDGAHSLERDRHQDVGAAIASDEHQPRGAPLHPRQAGSVLDVSCTVGVEGHSGQRSVEGQSSKPAQDDDYQDFLNELNYE